MNSRWQRNGGEIEFEEQEFSELAYQIANTYKRAYDKLMLEYKDPDFVGALLKRNGYTYTVEVGFELCLTRTIETPKYTLIIEEGRTPGDMRRDPKRGKAWIEEKK